jgi:hypothetical protein
LAALSSASAALREAWIAASSAWTDAVSCALGTAFGVLVDASAASCEIIAAHTLSGIASERARQVAPTAAVVAAPCERLACSCSRHVRAGGAAASRDVSDGIVRAWAVATQTSTQSLICDAELFTRGVHCGRAPRGIEKEMNPSRERADTREEPGA